MLDCILILHDLSMNVLKPLKYIFVLLIFFIIDDLTQGTHAILSVLSVPTSSQFAVTMTGRCITGRHITGRYRRCYGIINVYE